MLRGQCVFLINQHKFYSLEAMCRKYMHPQGIQEPLALTLMPRQGQNVQTTLELTGPLCSAVSSHIVLQAYSKCTKGLLNSKSCNVHTRLGKTQQCDLM